MDILDAEVDSTALVDHYVKQGERAFTSSVQKLADEINVDNLEERIRSFDIEGAINEIGVDESSFSLLEMVFMGAWTSSMATTFLALSKWKSALKGLRAISRQDNEMLAAYADLVGRIVNDLVEQQRGAVTATILSGLSAKKRTRDIALELAGRYDKNAGHRVGSVLGLTNRQVDMLDKLDLALRTNDKKYLRDYLKFKTRDQRYDAMVRRAINGQALTNRERITIVSRLADRNLYHRAQNFVGDTIRMIFAAAQDQMVERQIRAGAIDQSLLTKVWHNMHDRKVRHSHVRLGDQEVAYGENFITEAGISIAYPHDPKAPISERSGCRCWLEFRYKGKKIGRSGFRGF